MVKNKISLKNVRKKKTAPISFLCLISVHILCIFRRLSSRHFSWTFLWTFYPVIFHGFSSGHFIRPFFMDFPLDILSGHFSWTFLWTFFVEFPLDIFIRRKNQIYKIKNFRPTLNHILETRFLSLLSFI